MFTYSAASCATPSGGNFSFSNTPTGSYSLQTLDYTASSNGSALLEFSFYTINGNDYWHLDDVSIVDINASSSEMLTNGDFESGNLSGWELLCISGCAGTQGIVTNSNCHTGLYCYRDACTGHYDFLRQTFITTMGHIYTLSFWIYTDSQPQQMAYVTIG